MYTSTINGGFGMIDVAEVMTAARLKRFAYLIEKNTHPIADLQKALGGTIHLKKKPQMDIEDVTKSSLAVLRKHHLICYGQITDLEMENDLILHRQLLSCEIKDVVKDRHENSIEMTMLRRSRVTRVADTLHRHHPFNLLCRIAEENLIRHLRQLKRIYMTRRVPDLDEDGVRMYAPINRQWLRVEQMSSRQIRDMSKSELCISRTKLINDGTDPSILYRKIAKLRNVANKTKLLRLLHGDVYCGTRLYRSGLAETDRCIRCFESETLNHLLLECPYSKEVWARLGRNSRTVHDILNNDIAQGELEIISEIISSLIFRKQVLPPEILIRTIMYRFKDGLSKQRGTIMIATNIVRRYELIGQWFT
jgi:hypothetical protein